MRFIQFLVESEHKARAQEVAAFIKNEVLPRFSVNPTRSRLSPNPQNRSQYLLTLDADTRNLHDADKQAMDDLLKDLGARVRKLVVRSRRQRIQFVIDPAKAEMDDLDDREMNPRHLDDEDPRDFDLGDQEEMGDDEDRMVDIGDEDDGYHSDDDDFSFRGFGGRLTDDHFDDDDSFTRR